MIDYSNEIFNTISASLREAYERITVMGEYVSVPAEFPCVAIDEISNIPSHLDSAATNKYAAVRYRIQVFSNKTAGKRAEARLIYGTVDEIMQGIGLMCKTFTTTPDVYNSNIYQITATYEGVIDSKGTIYRN